MGWLRVMRAEGRGRGDEGWREEGGWSSVARYESTTPPSQL